MDYYGYVYRITNNVNGKVYIGQTSLDRPHWRWTQHRYYASKGKINPLYNSMRKYGESAFAFQFIVKCLDQDHLDRAERMCIRLFKSTDGRHGYNIEFGGNGTGKIPASTRKKMSEAHKKRPGNLEHCQRNAAKKRKPCYVQGTWYESMRAAERALNIRLQTIRYRIAQGWDGYYIVEDGPAQSKMRRSKPCVINGKRYATLSDASREVNLCVTAIANRIKRNKPGYSFAS